MTGVNIEITTIQLTPIEVAQFLEFRRHEQLFKDLIAAKIFDIKGGKATLSFNTDGILTDVKIEVQTFKRTRLNSG